LVAEGFVYATGSQQATDALLLLGVALVTVAVAMLHGAQRMGLVASILAGVVIIGGLCQVATVAAGLLLDSDLGWLHGIGFLAMGLGLIGYGILTLRSGCRELLYGNAAGASRTSSDVLEHNQTDRPCRVAGGRCGWGFR
jgi:hypothetical protein